MTPNHARRRLAVGAAATLSLLAGTFAAGVPAAQAETVPGGRATLEGTAPEWTSGAADAGATSGATQVSARVYLAGRDAQGLTAYATAVSDPNSSSFGKYLTPAQAEERFGASPQQVAAVTAWLKSAGLTVTGSDRHYVSVTGDAAAVQKAFATPLHDYRKDGRTFHAPAHAASAPRELADAVLTVTGLDNAPHRAKPQDTLPGPGEGFRNAGPFSTYFGSNTATTLPDAYGGKVPYAIHGYTGRQLRAAYGAGGYTGKGVTVAITDAYASPTMAADAAAYAKRNGDRAYRKGQYSEVLPSAYTSVDDCGASGWYGEESLDVEAVHAVAPEADIVYVGAASCNDPDLLDALNKIVDSRLADIVSNSWGDIEANETSDTAAAYDRTFKLGAIEGIGFYFSSGDDGDEVANTGKKQVDTPANSAWVTAVGGTSLAVGQGDKYQFETGWGVQKSVLARGRQELDELPRHVHRRRGRRRQLHRQAAVLPARRGARRDGEGGRLDPDAHRSGHRGGRRLQHRVPGRPDPVLAGRLGVVRRVPDRRHLAGRAGHRGRPGAGAAGPALPDRLRQPGDLRPLRLAALPRRDRPAARRGPRDRGGPGRLRQQHGRVRRSDHLGAQPRQGQLAVRGARLRRGDRCRLAGPRLRRLVRVPVLPPLTADRPLSGR